MQVRAHRAFSAVWSGAHLSHGTRGRSNTLSCTVLGVRVQSFLEKADGSAPEGERTPLVAREKAADGASAWRWKSECSDARCEGTGLDCLLSRAPQFNGHKRSQLTS